jgi:hypothetical protein
VGADALEDEGGAEDRVPRARGERPGTDLGGTAVGHSRDDGCAGGEPGRARGGGAHRADDRTGADDVRQQTGRDPEPGQFVVRPSLVDQVVAGLQGVARVARHLPPGQPPGDQVGLVQQPRVGEVGVVQQPQQLGQRPGRLHRPVAEVPPDGSALLVDAGGVRAGAPVVVHEAGREGPALPVGEEDGAGGGVDGHAPDALGRDAGEGLAARGGDGGPPLPGVLFVAGAVAPAGERAGCGGDQPAAAVDRDGAGALGAEVEADVDGVGAGGVRHGVLSVRRWRRATSPGSGRRRAR